MIQIIKKNLLLVAAVAALAFAALLMPATVSAGGVTIDGGLNCGSDVNLSDTSCAEPTEGTQRVQDTIRTIINIFSVLVGAVAVIMIIIGGFRYITSGGDSNNIGGAKNTILFAIVGLVIVAIAQAIVQFVLSEAV